MEDFLDAENLEQLVSPSHGGEGFFDLRLWVSGLTECRRGKTEKKKESAHGCPFNVEPRLLLPGQDFSIERTYFCDNLTASRTAANKLPGFAFPCQAISKAVPWSTLVRKTGRPRVVFTALSKAIIFTGM